jgi:hypothetical protein
MLVLSITFFRRRERFRLRVFLVRMWLPWDLEKVYLPVPVFLNRFAAARFVLIFGIESLLCNVHPPRWCRRVGSKTAVA